MSKWKASDVPDQTGKVVAITGGNSGIGYEAARVLLARHARVLLLCRDAARMKAAAEALRREVPGAQVDEVVLDVSSLASVRAGAAEVARLAPRLDVLLNNAGIMEVPEGVTVDGVERQFGTNHLGHFALTNLLLPVLSAAPAARVVTVSSFLHRKGELVFEDIPKPRAYDASRAYGMSKLCNLLFTYELDRRLQAAKSPVRAMACHPGWSQTNLFSGDKKASLGQLFARLGTALIAQPADMGALPSLFAATAPEAKGGGFYGPTGMNEMRGFPEAIVSSPASRDEAAAKRLWEVSAALAG
jgi:NAD(P)-dependent dehydrogenase (short-subunit alcohol dehydrogenase family)